MQGLITIAQGDELAHSSYMATSSNFFTRSGKDSKNIKDLCNLTCHLVT